ncbi:hypothetical protein ACETAC_05960 [Aceticella autotrophica]|uniref:Uncharacterized protein n=1 Tax=Aceticella autotrophica TaxID=2755338 RepID=A0A974Y2L3_9THEO|nr:hypothetical protein [Aceticella autotrophica]QSZ26469.1 hypothetical protein ACETAC_05960 [Aceticella autotrophica]
MDDKFKALNEMELRDVNGGGILYYIGYGVGYYLGMLANTPIDYPSTSMGSDTVWGSVFQENHDTVNIY